VAARVSSQDRARTAHVADSIEQLNFELTAGALAEQERAPAAMRTRAGTVLAAASIAGSFFGAQTSHGSLGTLGVLAIVSFALCVACAIWVLVPHEFVFAFRGAALLAETDHRGVSDVVDAYRTAGIWIEPYTHANAKKVGGPSDWLAISCALLAAEVLLWTVSILG
jgi:hypothetical protein